MYSHAASHTVYSQAPPPGESSHNILVTTRLTALAVSNAPSGQTLYTSTTLVETSTPAYSTIGPAFTQSDNAAALAKEVALGGIAVMGLAMFLV